jgi:hypothetical protein
VLENPLRQRQIDRAIRTYNEHAIQAGCKDVILGDHSAVPGDWDESFWER